MKLALNPRVAELEESATLKINQTAKRMREAGEDLCHLGFGESPFPVPELLQQALRENTHHKSYLPGPGLPELREAVAGFFRKEFGYDAAMERVFVGPGSKELLFDLLYLLEGPLLVPAPSWVSYGPQARMLGKPVQPIPTLRENRYRLQAEELERACQESGSGQKLLILTNPSNPTGSVHHAQELQELAEVCRRYQVLVIADEIYALVNFSDRPFIGMATLYPEGTIVTSGLSKAFSAGGWRLGVALLPEALADLAPPWEALVSETFSCTSAPIQYAAIPAFADYETLRPEVERCVAVHRAAAKGMWRALLGLGLNCPEPEGAFYLFPDFEPFREQLAARKIGTSPELATRLLEDAKVALLPGTAFYMPPDHLSVRVAPVDYDGSGFLEFDGADEQDLTFPSGEDAVRRIGSFLQNVERSLSCDSI